MQGESAKVRPGPKRERSLAQSAQRLAQAMSKYCAVYKVLHVPQEKARGIRSAAPAARHHHHHHHHHHHRHHVQNQK